MAGDKAKIKAAVKRMMNGSKVSYQMVEDVLAIFGCEHVLKCDRCDEFIFVMAKTIDEKSERIGWTHRAMNRHLCPKCNYDEGGKDVAD